MLFGSDPDHQVLCAQVNARRYHHPMRVTILGSGTAIPSFERFPSGVLVQVAGRNLLVDAGPGTLRRLAQTGVSPRDVDAVLLTHYHTDHTADVAALLFALRNPAYRGRPTLRIFGAPGLEDFMGHLRAAWPWLKPKADDYSLELVEVEPGTFAVPGDGPELRVHAVPIRHTGQSLAYRISDPAGGSAAFSGDADVCDGLAQVAKGAELFVCGRQQDRCR